MSLPDIKQAVKTKLDALVTSNVLAAAEISDIKLNPLFADTSLYPHAYLMPPSIESEILDNRTVVRSYTFDIVVLWKAENLADDDELETDIEAIMDAFDNDPTLGGEAVAGMPPTSSSPAPYQHNGKDLIMAVIQLTASTTKTLTFS